MKTSKPPSGRTIVLEILREMEERRYPLMYRTLPPGVYHVYMHPDDFREIEPIVPLIVADAQLGLNARVDELNRRSRFSQLVAGKEPPLDVPASGWEIHIHAEANGELLPGELGIESRLSIPPPPRYEGGAPTVRIGRTVVTGSVRREAAPTLSPAEPAAPPAPAQSLPMPATPAPARAAAPDATATAAAALGSAEERSVTPGAATLAYVDDEGPHVFVMRKDLISIGRGGSAHWVDVQVVAGARVSREHCRIRRAPDGGYWLQDVSSWGTSVDGRVVAPFARQSAESVEQLGHEHALPPRCQIQLADVVRIDFAVESS
jgi:hypothetical protein